MLPEDFVHLHVHSEYSILDGSIRIKKLVETLVARGAKSAALTDHDAMHGAIEFWLACQDAKSKEGPAKINGIIGYELNVACFSPSLANERPSHLILLAANNDGYRNLVKLCTCANTTGTNLHGPSSTSVTWNEVQQYSTGLICLTACWNGELSRLMQADRADEAAQFLAHLRATFGSENVYIELTDNQLPGQSELKQTLANLGRTLNMPLVATGDVHYLKAKDKEKHLSLLAIKHKLRQDDIERVDKSFEFHLTTYDEMLTKFGEWPDSLENTKVIADRCHVKIDTKTFHMPDFRQRPDETADDCMIRLSREGLEKRRNDIERAWREKFNEELWQQYKDRLEYELSVIEKMKFAGYFLIVQDFINWAKEQDIPVGPGRGSAAGSIVTYALRITDIDPIRFNLLFERFLNPERISMPDIDTDFCQDRRGDVLDYVYKKYGNRAVAQIATFGTMAAKASLKALARISGWKFKDANDFAALIPTKPDITLQKALDLEPKIKERLNNDDRAAELWTNAGEIEGNVVSLGIHAAGVIISSGAIDERCPLMESDGQILTQYEHKYAEKIGLIKFDFLGLKTLTVIDKAVKLIRRKKEPEFDIAHIDIEDPKVYAAISTAHVTGIFQLESQGMRKLIADLKPTCFNDIIAVLALFRPGPLGSGMVADFVKRKHGEIPVEYPFAELESVLSDTYGVIVYQEQVQKIAAVLAGFTLGEADLLRRVMGKKDAAEMARQKEPFVERAAQKGHDRQKIADLFDLIGKFAEYGFNKSHTAAYGWVTYQTAFLKTYYPTEFMTAIMTCDLGNTEKMIGYWRDARRMNIKVRPPDVNGSLFEFTIPEENAILFGLGAIKGLGQGVIDLIVKEREKNGVFSTIPEFIARVGARSLNKKIMESLTKAGAFDSIASNRAEILHNSDLWLRTIAREEEQQETNGGGIFGAFNPPATKKSPSRKKSDTTPAAALSTVKPTLLSVEGSPVAHLLIAVQIKPFAPWPLLKQLEGEMDTLGFCISGHPSDVMRDDLLHCAEMPIDEVPLHVEADDVPKFKRKKIRVAGMVSNAFERKNREEQSFLSFTLEDGTGSLDVVIFADKYAVLTTKIKQGDFVWVDCRISRGTEEGSVRAECLALGKLEEARLESLKSLVLETTPEFLNNEKGLIDLTLLLKKHPGSTPVRLEAVFPEEKIRMRAWLDAHSIRATDQLIYAIEEQWPGMVKPRRSFATITTPS